MNRSVISSRTTLCLFLFFLLLDQIHAFINFREVVVSTLSFTFYKGGTQKNKY